MRIIGHQKIIKRLERQLDKQAVSHAYLFSGPESVGKFTVALEFARKLGAEPQGIDPDLIIIKPVLEEHDGALKKKDIKIEEIRELQRQLGFSPQRGRWKITIIDEADRLNVVSQNALLKTLEEARKQNVIILVAQDERRILPTVLSRCQRIKFGMVSATDMKKNCDAETNGQQTAFWSLGRPGLMQKLKNNPQEMQIREAAADRLKRIFSFNIQQKMALAEEWSKDIQLALQNIGFWTVILREIINGRGAMPIDPEKSLFLLEAAQAAAADMRETNANPRLVLENLFLKL